MVGKIQQRSFRCEQNTIHLTTYEDFRPIPGSAWRKAHTFGFVGEQAEPTSFVENHRLGVLLGSFPTARI